MPLPPPACEGYAFEANGSAAVPIDAPLSLSFDDLPVGPGGLGLPQEEWCYRDTPVQPPPDNGRWRRPSARSTPAHAAPPLPARSDLFPPTLD